MNRRIIPLLLSSFLGVEMFILSLLFAAFPAISASQSPTTTDSPTDKSEHWLMHPSMQVNSTEIEHAKFPVVDIHTHFYFKGKRSPEFLDAFVSMMDRNNIAVCVSLDGTLGTRLSEHFSFLSKDHRDRFLVFANIDFQGTAPADNYPLWECNQPYFVRNVVEQLHAAHREGVVAGLKFFKDFGLRYRDTHGELIQIDDLRWQPIWECCAELGIPVIMHTADPSAFFREDGELNERTRELAAHPDWSFAGPEFPKREDLLEARNRVIARNPKTEFIGAHFCNDAEDLKQLGDWLDSWSNLHIEFASRINELGRQPYSARDFFVKYQDRILFGTDGPWPEARLKLYWRFLETRDEYFPYSDKVPPPQGDWNIYGIHLDDAVLKKVYFENATKLIPGVQSRLEKYQQRQLPH